MSKIKKGKNRKTLTQDEWVYSKLKAGRKLTQLQVLKERDIGRLSALIYSLRRMGVPIVTKHKIVKKGNESLATVAEYSIPK